MTVPTQCDVYSKGSPSKSATSPSLPFSSRAGAVSDAEQLGGVNGDARERGLEAEAVGRGDGGLEEDDARLGHVGLVAALQRDGDAGVVELAGGLHAEVFHVLVAALHRGMDDDGEAAGFDFVDHKRGVGAAVEDDLDLELLREAERGDDVLLAIHGDEKRLGAIEAAEDRLQAQVTAGALGLVLALALLGVFLRLDELGAQHSESLGARAGGFGGGAGRAIGGVQAISSECNGSHGGGIDDILIRFTAERFHDHRLAGNQRGGRMAGVDRGDAERPHVRDKRIPGVVGVDRAQLGLHGSGFFPHVLILRLISKPDRPTVAWASIRPGVTTAALSTR